MTVSEARDELEAMLAWEAVPALTTTEVTLCLNRSRVIDADGLAPSDADWTPTYDLNIGAAHGWRLKAGKAAGLHDYRTAGLGVSKSQIRKACLAMADEYRRKIAASIPTPGVMNRDDYDD